jgi:hypothetical protein
MATKKGTRTRYRYRIDTKYTCTESTEQCFGSALVSMRIRIQHVRSMRIRIQSFDDQVLEKFAAEKKIVFY